MSNQLRGRLAALLFSILPALQVSADSELRISNAWIREAPPGTTVLAGYMTITNPADVPRIISSVSSNDFGAAGIHRTIIENGMARMQSADKLEIPAGGRLALEPGSYHLMLFDPARPLVSGDVVDLLLHIDNGPCLTVSATITRPDGNHHP